MLRTPSTLTSVVVALAVADSGEISYGDYAGGRYSVPVASPITAITWYDTGKLGGTYLPSYTAAGAAITQAVVAGRRYEIPPELAGARALKAIGDAAGTITDVSLKA